MSFEKADLRAAVNAGVLTESQAANFSAFARSRKHARETAADGDEPFEIFSGFNEIFVVVGLGILFLGVTGTLFALLDFEAAGSVATGTVLGLLVLILARYFTLRRKMVAPSIALSISFAGAGIVLGVGLMTLFGADTRDMFFIPPLVATTGLLAYWKLFRVPFTVALIAVGILATAITLLLYSNQASFMDLRDMFLLSADGPLGLVTFGLGIAGFIIALRFDMSDPHRVTRRSANGFWLHIVAAPAIVSTIALTLFDADTVVALFALLGFLSLIAIVAMIIDRRSFLLAAVGYVVTLVATVIDAAEAFFVVTFLLGILLLFLGSTWERIRARIMVALPEFAGKSRLPPYSQPVSRTE